MRGSDLIVFGTLFPVPPDMKCYRVSWQTTNGSGTVDIQFDNGPVQTVKIVDNRIERQP